MHPREAGWRHETAKPLASLPESSRLTLGQTATLKQLHEMTSQISQGVPTFVRESSRRRRRKEKTLVNDTNSGARSGYFLYPSMDSGILRQLA